MRKVISLLRILMNGSHVFAGQNLSALDKEET
jgi:hypothetical protein